MTPSAAREVGGRPVLLLAVLGIFLVQKLHFDPVAVGAGRADGTFYYQVARHVARGDGLVTSVSLYEQGLRDMPSPTNVHPLWPLVLGYAGRAMGLDRAAVLLPEILFFADLLLLYALANRLGERQGSPVLLRVLGRPVADVGHVAVLLLGSNPVFFAFTSLPWTEALAFGLLFAALLALDRAARGAAGWAALAGGLAGLAFLARSQLAAAPLAVVATLCLGALGDRRRRAHATAAVAGALLVVLPWVIFLLSLPGRFRPSMLLDFTAYRETPGLLPFPGFVAFDTLGARLADLLAGLVYSFGPGSSHGYVASFGAAVYLIPVALVSGAWRVARARPGWRDLAAPGRHLPVCVALTWIGCLAPAYAMHAAFPFPWSFHWRHGLPMVLGIVLALCWLRTRRREVYALALALVAIGLYASFASPSPIGREVPPPRPFERALFGWLDAHAEPPVVLSTKCREIALGSRAVTHWTRCGMSPARTRVQLAQLPIDYVVVYPSEHACSFARGLDDELERVRAFGSLDVYRARR